MNGFEIIQTALKKPGRTCLIAMTLLWWKWRFFKLGWKTVVRRCLQINNPQAVAIGSHVTIMHQAILADLNPEYRQYPKISIGDGCTILYRFQCNAAQSVSIGSDVLIASNVLITDSDHVVEPEGAAVTKNNKLKTKPVVIGDGCWIGQNAVILKGVKIGKCCIIGANSVVTRDVPERSVVAGNPARIIKSL